MAFLKWTLLHSVLLIFISSTGNIDAQSCGGNYTANYGVFMSPNYPNVYDLNVECTYTISLSTIGSITLNFETFELDRSPEDYISVTCGSNISFVEKKYEWNSNIPPISIPWCSSGRLYFYSDSSHNYTTRGFRVQYQVDTKDCGNTVFTSSSGTISSPNYPQYYNNNENCTYSIWAPEASSFTLNFEEFMLEKDCQRDWVQIRCANSGYILPKYCGTTLQKTAYISNCNKVLIWFHTGNKNAFCGFSLQYSVTPDGCGKSNYAGLSGIITSPNYPQGYNQVSCSYYLYPVSSVTLSFQSFDLEPFIDSTNGDYVQIECSCDHRNSNNSYRGNTIPPMISCSLCYLVVLHFHTNNVTSGIGFNVRYQVNPLVAQSAITNAPKNFTVDIGSRVQLNCTSDATGYYPSWILSKDGTNENTVTVATYCKCIFEDCSMYSFATSGPGECNLVITNATLAEAGIYTCFDVGLASITSFITVVVPTTTSTVCDQGQTDSEIIIIVLAVLLAICILGYIGEAIFFTVRRCRETSRGEEAQRNPSQDMMPASDAVKTRAIGSVYEDLPVRVLSWRSSTTDD